MNQVEEIAPERFTLHTGVPPSTQVMTYQVMLQQKSVPDDRSWNWYIGEVVTALSLAEWCFYNSYKLITCFHSWTSRPGEDTKLL